MLNNRRPRNHPQDVARLGARDDVDTRVTPLAFYAALAMELGFTLDVAASRDNAKTPAFFDLEADGLAQPWAPARVWCNPPYSNIGDWVAKAWAEHRAGCPLIAMLLPANRTEQPWWQDMVEPFRDGRGPIECRFIRRRLEFLKHCGGRASVPFGSVVLIWRSAGDHP